MALMTTGRDSICSISVGISPIILVPDLALSNVRQSPVDPRIVQSDQLLGQAKMRKGVDLVKLAAGNLHLTAAAGPLTHWTIDRRPALYKRLLLASDGTRESLVALREGALIAQSFGASAHLLIIDPDTTMGLMAEGYDGLPLPAPGQTLLDLGLARLGQLGVQATGELLRGEPTPLIIDRLRQLKIDLVVLRHRRQSFLKVLSKGWPAEPRAGSRWA